MKRFRHFATALLGGAVLLVLNATGLLAQGPTLSISNPSEGTTVGAPVTIEWAAEGVTIKPASEATQHEEAHFHLFVDKVPALVEGQGIPAGDPQIIHTGSTSMELPDLAAGEHTVTVVLGYSDHTPWMPQVMDSVTFTVGDPAPATMPPSGGNPLVGVWATLAGLALLGSAAWMWSRRRTA